MSPRPAPEDVKCILPSAVLHSCASVILTPFVEKLVQFGLVRNAAIADVVGAYKLKASLATN